MFRSKRGGLTLIELLVVIAIISILIALLIPARRNVRDAAARTQCTNNIRQLMLGLHSYEDKHKALPKPSFPEAAADKYFPSGCLGLGTNPDERLSWIVGLLPYLDQPPLSTRFDFAKGYAGNSQPAKTPLNMLVCPSANIGERPDPVTTYVAMAGIGPNAAAQPAGTKGSGFMGYDRLTTLAMIKDGASNTIALMETRADLGPWARGGVSTLRGFDTAVSLQGDQAPFGGHPAQRGMIVAMADGSARFLLSSIEPSKLAAALTIADGDQDDVATWID